ncbi:MAG: hypothetical protein KAR39_02920 [Thermoplasmata archaeon]|nr:hypothetical protein [Thermoplasmata archaeon]
MNDSIESIKKVEVTEISAIEPLTRASVDGVTHPFGAYLVFKAVGDSDIASYRARDYCHIGRAAGGVRGVKGRLLGNIDYHEVPNNDCGPLEGHFFQVLACDNEVDAARLECLFHLWHGRYQGGRTPIEPKGTPAAEKEPDFFYTRR